MESVTLLRQSSLEKIFPDDTAFQPSYEKAGALRGETLAYQIVLKKSGWGLGDFSWSLESPLAAAVPDFDKLTFAKYPRDPPVC